MSNFKLSTAMTASGRIGQNFSCAIIETANEVSKFSPEQIPALRAIISKKIVDAKIDAAEAHDEVQTRGQMRGTRAGRRMAARVTRADARLHVLETAIEALI